MAVTISIQSVRQVISTGRYYVDFSDGTQMEFETIGQMQEQGVEIDSDDEGGRLLARKLLLRRWLAEAPDPDSPGFPTHPTVELDLQAAAPLRFL